MVREIPRSYPDGICGLFAHNSRIRKFDGNFSSTLIDDELIVFHLGNGQFFTLKDSALRIWTALDETGDVNAICAMLEKEYSVEPDECRQSVQAFIDQLVAVGFAEFR